MINNIGSYFFVLTKARNIMLFILLQIITTNAWAFEVLNNGKLRFGTGAEDSVNTLGNLQQPFYYDENLGIWQQLTIDTNPLDNAVGLSGDGTSEWNINGIVEVNSVLTGQNIDTSGFVISAGSDGYGVIISSGTITINGSDLGVKNTYELLEGSAHIKIITEITNNSASIATNLRVWVGTQDDYVGTDDNPTKLRGNLVDGIFTALATQTEKATALKITSANTGVLLLTTSTKATTSIADCCEFSNVTEQDPAAAVITITDDNSYGFYVRMDDLANGESEAFEWYYAAGSLSELDGIVTSVSDAVDSSNIDGGYTIDNKASGGSFNLFGLILLSLLTLFRINYAQAKESSFYIDLGIGSALSANSNSYLQQKVEAISSSATITDRDKNTFAYRAQLGYQANKWVALEVGYTNLGEQTLTITDTALPVDVDSVVEKMANVQLNSASGATFGGKLSYPISNWISIYTRIGGFIWHGDYDSNSSVNETLYSSIKVSDHGTDLYYGLGVQLPLYENFSFALDWQRYELTKYKTDLITGAIIYKF
ncbi:outer membrane beta-barrel protein [Moritella sp. PE36]|uniref:outer membrane beta-barrel protein n=1 Tax=Moritella sp. PE36 TaxID=58051 RepID=UPI0002FD548A|nr:outer membrane beta-barrel protein [Moritella sp. PE36]